MGGAAGISDRGNHCLLFRPRGGRAKKLWKKSQTQLNENEKHVFCRVWHNRRFDRAVTQEIKEKRYIPDDPYKVNPNSVRDLTD